MRCFRKAIICRGNCVEIRQHGLSERESTMLTNLYYSRQRTFVGKEASKRKIDVQASMNRIYTFRLSFLEYMFRKTFLNNHQRINEKNYHKLFMVYSKRSFYFIHTNDCSQYVIFVSWYLYYCTVSSILENLTLWVKNQMVPFVVI